MKFGAFSEINYTSRRPRSFKFLFYDFLKVISTFGLVFNITFAAFPSINTGRLVFFILILIYGKEALKLAVNFSMEYTFYFVIFLLLIPFSMIWLAINGAEDTVILSRSFWFLVFSILSSFLYVCMCRFSLSVAMAYYLIAMLVQTFFVLYSIFNPDFRIWLEHALPNSGNIDFSDGVRLQGFSNGGGSLISLQLSFGVAAALVLFSLSKSTLGKVSLVAASLMITIATIFVGRSGLYLSFFMLSGFFIFCGRTLFIIMILSFIAFAFCSFFLMPNLDFFVLENTGVKFDRTVIWAFEFFLFGESDSANALLQELHKIRQISVTELIIGSGRVVQQDGSNYAGHDSGYLHSLFALGLPLSLLFYSSLFLLYYQMLKPVKGHLKIIGLVLISLVFILEIKEPFVFKYTIPFFVLVYVYLARFCYLSNRKGVR